METKKLYRSCDDKIIGGVAGGLAEYLEIDSIIVRLLFLIMIFSSIGLAAYVIAWVLIPENPNCANPKEGAEEIVEKASGVASTFYGKNKEENTDVRIIVGTVLLALGVLLLFQNLVGDYVWKVFWPVVLVFIGLYFISKSKK